MLRLMIWTIGLFAFAQLASADQSPVMGYFRYIALSDRQSDAKDQLSCAFGFFHQDAAGRGQDYVLDQEKFAETGEVAYRVISTFECKYIAAGMSEVCRIKSSFPEIPDFTAYFLYDTVTSDHVDAKTFETFADWTAAAKTKVDAARLAVSARFVRCDGFTAASLRPFIDLTPVNPDDEAITAGLEYPFSDGLADQRLQDARRIRQLILGH